MASRRAHNPEVVGSNSAPEADATCDSDQFATPSQEV